MCCLDMNKQNDFYSHDSLYYLEELVHVWATRITFPFKDCYPIADWNSCNDLINVNMVKTEK